MSWELTLVENAKEWLSLPIPMRHGATLSAGIVLVALIIRISNEFGIWHSDKVQKNLIQKQKSIALDAPLVANLWREENGVTQHYMGVIEKGANGWTLDFTSAGNFFQIKASYYQSASFEEIEKILHEVSFFRITDFQQKENEYE